MLRIGFVVVLLGIGSLGCGGATRGTQPPGEKKPPAEGHADCGTVLFDGGSGKDSFWKDTDGVEPESAGCHVEYAAAGCGAAASPGRNFGEKCLTGDLLLETNPEPDKCHTHPEDLGHPFAVPCNRWCKDLYAIPLPTGPKTRGTASASGRCEAVGELPCGGAAVSSARCVCSD